MDALDSIEMLIIAAFVMLPASVASLTWRANADLRAYGAEEDRKGGLAAWAAVHGCITLMLWARVSWVIRHLRDGTISHGEVGLLITLLLVSPCAIGWVLARGTRMPRVRSIMAFFGLIHSTSTTPWDRLSASKQHAFRLVFRDGPKTYRGMVVSFDTEADQVLVQYVDVLDDATGAWTQRDDVTGAMLFERGSKVMWFTQHPGSDLGVIEPMFVDPWRMIPKPKKPQNSKDASAAGTGVATRLRRLGTRLRTGKKALPTADPSRASTAGHSPDAIAAAAPEPAEGKIAAATPVGAAASAALVPTPVAAPATKTEA